MSRLNCSLPDGSLWRVCYTRNIGHQANCPDYPEACLCSYEFPDCLSSSQPSEHCEDWVCRDFEPRNQTFYHAFVGFVVAVACMVLLLSLRAVWLYRVEIRNFLNEATVEERFAQCGAGLRNLCSARWWCCHQNEQEQPFLPGGGGDDINGGNGEQQLEEQEQQGAGHDYAEVDLQ